MLYLGIDPGAHGGLAAVTLEGVIYRVDKLPPTIAETYALFEALAANGQAFAVLESVHAFPKMGAVSAFTFGRGFGNLEAMLHCAGIPYDLVAPQKWQGHMSCLSRGDKNVTKRRAQQLFPKHTVIHAIADALLMAEYCRRMRTGQLSSLPARTVRATDGEKEKEGSEETSRPLQGQASQRGDAMARRR